MADTKVNDARLRRQRVYTATSHSSNDSETHNSPRKSRQGGRSARRLSIKGERAGGPTINMTVTTSGGPAKKKRPRQNDTSKQRLPVDEGGIERKLDIRDQARDCHDRVDVALAKFDKVLNKDHYRLGGRRAGTGSSYDVLKLIQTETNVLTENLDRIGYERDEVMEDIGNWMGGRSGEAAHMDRELRDQLMNGQEEVTDLVKESITDMVSRMELFTTTSATLHGIFERTVETAAREIKDGVKKGAEIAVAYEKEKMTASKNAMASALLEDDEKIAEEKRKEEEEKQNNRDRSDSVAKANEALKAQPDPAVLDFIVQFITCRDRMKKAEGQIRTFELASFASEDKFKHATEEWEEKRTTMNRTIKEARDSLRLAEKKLERSHMKAREKEVRERKANETQSFVEKKSKRKGTEMLKMQINTLKTRVKELELEVESTDNQMEEFRMEIQQLEEKLEATRDMVTRAAYDDIKRQLFEASDLVEQARAETTAAQKDTADAKAETEKAYEEKALVLDQLAKAQTKITEQDAEITKLKLAVEAAAEEKKRALAEQKAEYEKLLQEEQERTEEQKKRADAAEELAAQRQDQIEALEEEMEQLKEQHEAEMEALREQHREFVEQLKAEHEEEKRQMEEAFKAEKKLLEDKIEQLEQDLEMIKTATGDALTAALQEIKSETTQLTMTAVSLYGRSEALRKIGEEGLHPPDQENVNLTEDVIALAIGSAVDLSETSQPEITKLAKASAATRLSAAYTNILNVIVRTEAYDQGLLNYLRFVQGTIDEDLVARFADQQTTAAQTFHATHTAIAVNSDEIRKSQLPVSFEDDINVESLMESRSNGTEKRLVQRRAREGAAKRQAETLVAVKQFLTEETQRCEVARNSLCQLDVECGKVQYYLETGGLEEGSTTLNQVLESLRSRRLHSTTVADMALLGPNVLITNPNTPLDVVQITSDAFNSTVRTIRELKIAIVENGSSPDGSESESVKELREQILQCSSELQQKRKELALAAQMESSDMERMIDLMADIGRAELMLMTHESNIQEMQEALDTHRATTSDSCNELFEVLANASAEKSSDREAFRDTVLAEQEGAMLEKVETLETAIETAAKVYDTLQCQTRSLRRELSKAESLKGRLCDFIGSSGQLGNQLKLIEEVRRTRSAWINQAIGTGVELSNLPEAMTEQLSVLYGKIEDWINSGGSPQPGQIVTRDDAGPTMESIQQLKALKVDLLNEHIVQDPTNANEGVNTLVPLIVNHMDVLCQMLAAKVEVVIEPNAAEHTTTVAALSTQLTVLEQDVSRMWETTQQAYYDTFKNEETEKLLRAQEELLAKLKAAEMELQTAIQEKEQAVAEALEAIARLEAMEAESGSSRGSSRRSRKSRGSSRGLSRGGQFGGGIARSPAMELQDAEQTAHDYNKMANMVLHLCSITERLRSVAPPMHKQKVYKVPEPVAELSVGVVQQLHLAQSLGEGEARNDALIDTMSDIGESSASKHMLTVVNNCLASLATQVASGIWVGKPHKTKIVAPKNIKNSLRVSRGTVRTTGNQRNGPHKSRKTKANAGALKNELATQKIYVTELELELEAMARQVRGHGKLEEMKRSMEKNARMKNLVVAKRFQYLQNKLKVEHAKKELLEQTMGEGEEEVPEKDLRAAKFHAMREFVTLEKEMVELQKLDAARKRGEVQMLNAFEDVHSMSNRLMGASMDSFSSKGLQESKVRRDMLRLGLLAQSTSSPGRPSLSPIKKQGKYLQGILGGKKAMGELKDYNRSLVETRERYDSQPVLGRR